MLRFLRVERNGKKRDADRHNIEKRLSRKLRCWEDILTGGIMTLIC